MKLFKQKNYILKDIIKMWLETKKDIKIQSVQKYEFLISHYLNNHIGNIYIKNLKEKDITNFFNNLNLSTSTQKTLFYIIKSSLKFAFKNKYCDYFELNEIKLKKNTNTIYILPKETQIKLELILKDKINIRKSCLLLCLYTGLRIGEVCGLKWEDIDFNNKLLRVKRTIQRIKNTDAYSKTILIESTPKSETSNRVIPIPDFIAEILEKFKTDDADYILSKSKKLYDPRQFEAFYERLLKNNNINYFNFHSIRHTFATRSIESKMDIKTLVNFMSL